MSEPVKLIVINAEGNAEALYADDLPDFGAQKITRASNVEPDPDGNGWMVQLTDTPRNGRFKGRVIARNVPTRAEALALEVDFIQRHVLGCNVAPQAVRIGDILDDVLDEIESARTKKGL